MKVLIARMNHETNTFSPVPTPLSQLGVPLTRVAMFSPPRVACSPDGTVVGQVIDIDRFGNLITNIESDVLPADGCVEVSGHTVRKISRTYAEGRDLVALVGSSGRLEVAWKNGSAAGRLGVDVGAPVTVVPRRLA